MYISLSTTKPWRPTDAFTKRARVAIAVAREDLANCSQAKITTSLEPLRRLLLNGLGFHDLWHKLKKKKVRVLMQTEYTQLCDFTKIT